VEQERIYVVGAYGYVHCLDVKTGTVIWEKHIGREYEVEEMSVGFALDRRFAADRVHRSEARRERPRFDKADRERGLESAR